MFGPCNSFLTPTEIRDIIRDVQPFVGKAQSASERNQGGDVPFPRPAVSRRQSHETECGYQCESVQKVPMREAPQKPQYAQTMGRRVRIHYSAAIRNEYR